MAELELLKKQRAAFKGQLTNFKTQVPTAESFGAVEVLLSRLQRFYDKYDGVQSKIEILDEFATPDRSGFEEEYSKLEIVLRDKLHDLKKSEDSSLSTSFHNTSQHELNPTTNVSAGVRLPELTLPFFSGLESEWLSFRDIFLDLIHSKVLDETVKFLYLISSIRAGSAFALIESLPVTAANYTVAWKLLCDKYNNEISIQRHHTRELYDARTPQEHSAKALQMFVEKIFKHYNALKSLKVAVSEWDLILVHHLIQRLDTASRVHVVKHTKPNDLLRFDELIQLLRNRVRVLETLASTSAHTHSRVNKSYKPVTLNVTHAPPASSSEKCSCCLGNHLLAHCPEFSSTKFTPRSRYDFIKNRRLCGNCLRDRHPLSECRQPPCQTCALKHHTLLHFERSSQLPEVKLQPVVANCSEFQSLNNDCSEATCAAGTSLKVSSETTSTKFSKVILIGTALVRASVNDGIQLLCRALLDSGSTMNFVTTQTCKLLQARKHVTSKTITGIAGSQTLIRHKIYLKISSCVSTFATTLKCYVLPTITHEIPSTRVMLPKLTLPDHIKLADPHFNVPNRIDILLGAEIYHCLFKGSSIQLHRDLPPFYESELGYVVSGKTNFSHTAKTQSQSHIALCSIQSLEAQLKRFWELESVSSKPVWSKEEISCESHFKENVERSVDGRYTVALPTNPKLNQLGSSDLSARRQFYALETRLQGKPEIYAQYQDFMNEYHLLGHMTAALNDRGNCNFYLPHHYVIKDQSETTKLRVVFNASAKSSSLVSLNDCLMVGPTIQQDLVSIMLRFRKHIVAFSADIAKMYRQIRIREDQQDLQRVFWRRNPSERLQIFRLATVTYGTASAPFLATRTLHQLANDERVKYPEACKILDNDFYVDDVLTGASTMSEASQLKTELIELLARGGFELRKFVSNMKQLSSQDHDATTVTILLGVMWNTKSDQFEMVFDLPSTAALCTKRTLLSELCQIFDPMGICAPIVVTGKLIMQAIWKLQALGWDDPLPLHIAQTWSNFKQELNALQRINIPRLITSPVADQIELHGFCDASERAYGCALYTRTISSTNQYQVNLICAKTRVSPLKKETIPRLELCAAVLLSELTQKVTSVLKMNFSAVYLWTDSQITLHRIKSEPSKYAVFVANRLSRIQELTSANDWYYVPTAANPADLASRGLMPSSFSAASLWWIGPEFLKSHSSAWAISHDINLPDEFVHLEVRKTNDRGLVHSTTDDNSLFVRFSSLTRLIRVVAYMIRFTDNARHRDIRKDNASIFLLPNDIKNATLCLIRMVQRSNFSDDIRCIKKTKYCSPSSSLRSLAIFLDKDGILRVGGRLNNAMISEDQKHPILLPGNHPFSVLIVRHEHQKLLHAGPQSLLYNLRLQYWITGGRNLCRTIVHQCVRCHRIKPQLRNQVMGELPSDRVKSVERPFLIVGVDFCGPFSYIQTNKARTRIKCYICLFVCFTTKAVHLELVMSASTESFLACLRRFIARRGICIRIYSENATNFVGSRSELKELKTLFLSQSFQDTSLKFCSENEIEWKTIPPRSPHFGGLWKAAIKSAKHHFKRAVGNAALTVEELLTLISQIEACLNSRPLTPLSSDPLDLTALSPGHFIIGAPLTSIPEPSLIDLSRNRLSRLQRIQQNLHQFWERWHKEYLSELQRRHKWRQGSHNFQVGSLVILQDDNIPPLKWNLGRITALHPGQDGITRVVTVKTALSELKRAVNRISVLPIHDENKVDEGDTK